MTKKIFTLPDPTRIYPGHDYKGFTCTTVAEEKRLNPRLTKSRPDFIAFMTNLKLDPRAYVDAFPMQHVGEIHLGGHDEDHDDHGAPLLIDSHGREVADPVWALLDHTLAKAGPKPLLIEWDNDVPDWPELAAEAQRGVDALSKQAALA